MQNEQDRKHQQGGSQQKSDEQHRGQQHQGGSQQKPDEQHRGQQHQGGDRQKQQGARVESARPPGTGT